MLFRSWLGLEQSGEMESGPGQMDLHGAIHTGIPRLTSLSRTAMPSMLPSTGTILVTLCMDSGMTEVLTIENTSARSQSMFPIHPHVTSTTQLLSESSAPTLQENLTFVMELLRTVLPRVGSGVTTIHATSVSDSKSILDGLQPERLPSSAESQAAEEARWLTSQQETGMFTKNVIASKNIPPNFLSGIS